MPQCLSEFGILLKDAMGLIDQATEAGRPLRRRAGNARRTARAGCAPMSNSPRSHERCLHRTERLARATRAGIPHRGTISASCGLRKSSSGGAAGRADEADPQEANRPQWVLGISLPTSEASPAPDETICNVGGERRYLWRTADEAQESQGGPRWDNGVLSRPGLRHSCRPEN